MPIGCNRIIKIGHSKLKNTDNYILTNQISINKKKDFFKHKRIKKNSKEFYNCRMQVFKIIQR